MKEVIFYETASGQKPIEGFLESLSAKEAQKVAWVLNLVEELASLGDTVDFLVDFSLCPVGALPQLVEQLIGDEMFQHFGVGGQGFDQVGGFGVRCRPSGHKYFFLKYRTKANRQRWYSIGRYGSPWTVDSARDKALKVTETRYPFCKQ